MTKNTSLALCSAVQLADKLPENGREWMHLLPAGGSVHTVDGRGPYPVADYAAVIANSMGEGDRLVVDECHSTDLAAPKGLPAPARGWITSMELRESGIWGKVEWTDEGLKLRESKAYRGISPVIAHTEKGKAIVSIHRASLVNQPNFKGLTALNQEEMGMELKEKIIKALGLDEGATDEQIIAALKKGDDAKPEEAVKAALQSAISPIAAALGLAEGVDSAAIVTGIGALQSGGDQEKVVLGLQSQLADVTGRFDKLTEGLALQAATGFVDGAIAEGRVGVKPQRALYISMHQENPERTETLVGSMAKVAGEVLGGDIPAGGAQGDVTQLAAQASEYQKKCAAAGQTIDFGAAVAAVVEGLNK